MNRQPYTRSCFPTSRAFRASEREPAKSMSYHIFNITHPLPHSQGRLVPSGPATCSCIRGAADTVAIISRAAITQGSRLAGTQRYAERRIAMTGELPFCMRSAPRNYQPIATHLTAAMAFLEGGGCDASESWHEVGELSDPSCRRFCAFLLGWGSG